MSTPNTIPPSLVNELPARVRDVFRRRPAEDLKAFLKTYLKKRKSVAVAYLFWILEGTHHAYFKQVDKQFWLWFSWLMPFGVWWFLFGATSYRGFLFYLATGFLWLVFGFATIWWSIDLTDSKPISNVDSKIGCALELSESPASRSLECCALCFAIL